MINQISTFLSNLKRSELIKSFITTALGSGLSKFIAVIATFYIAHVLSKEDFGVFSFARNTLQMIFVVCALNFCNLCTKFTAEAEVSEKSRYRLVVVIAFSLIVCFLVGMALFLAPKTLLLSVVGLNSLIAPFRIIGLMLPIFMWQPLIDGILRGKKRFKLVGMLQVIMTCFFFAAIVYGIYIKGLEGAISGLLIYYLLYSIVSSIILFSLIRFPSVKDLKHDLICSYKEIEIIPRMVLPIFFLSFVEAPINWWAQVIMANHDSYSAVGSMSAILQIRNVGMLVPSYFFSTFTVFASTLNAQHQYIEYFRKFRTTFKLILYISLWITALSILLAPILLGLYGKQYTTETLPFIIAMIPFPLLVLTNLLKVHLVVREHQKLMLVISLLSSFIFISSLYLLIYARISGAIAFFAAQILQLVVMYFISYITFKRDRYVLQS